jgi:UDP-N-acetylglucosamine 2-epimerase (non-hydrolysing)
MHVVSVVGARPQFIKLAPVAEALAEIGAQHFIIHTGQHYDPNMSDVFFSELSIPSADINLGIGSASHGRQTGQMLEALEVVLVDQKPHWVLAYGDTNSTIACALAAVKLHLPLAHLEAGLRSFNRRMPEEHNRVLTDHAADLLLAPSPVAVANLQREGLAERTDHVGDVMVDIAHRVERSLQDEPEELPEGFEPQTYVLATIHRAENTDDTARLRALIRRLSDFDCPVVLAAHPRLRARAVSADIDLDIGSIRVCEPLSYRSMMAAVLGSVAVVTDSGGLQKEAFTFGVPCTTVRSETEWTETVENGWNVLVPEPEDLHQDRVCRQVVSARGTPYGEGDAAFRAVSALHDRIFRP